MLFSVIYSVDCVRDESIRRYLPSQRHLFRQTEGDEQYEYSYLEGAWEKGKHRKLCAVLNRQQFDRFVSDCGLVAEDVKTMGALGTPGCGFGWAPAISFNGEHYSAISNAYVTPLPDKVRESAKPLTEERWERVRRAVLSVYG